MIPFDYWWWLTLSICLTYATIALMSRLPEVTTLLLRLRISFSHDRSSMIERVDCRKESMLEVGWCLII